MLGAVDFNFDSPFFDQTSEQGANGAMIPGKARTQAGCLGYTVMTIWLPSGTLARVLFHLFHHCFALHNRDPTWRT